MMPYKGTDAYCFKMSSSRLKAIATSEDTSSFDHRGLNDKLVYIKFL